MHTAASATSTSAASAQNAAASEGRQAATSTLTAITAKMVMRIARNTDPVIASFFLSATLPSDAAAFWALAALVLVADAAVCVLLFTRAFYDAGSVATAPPYTIAYRSDGYIELCHRSGRREYFAVRQVADVRAYPAKLGFVIYGWAYSGNLNYGKVTFFLSDAGRLKKRSVKMVANCMDTARFIREDFLPTVTGAERQ